MHGPLFQTNNRRRRPNDAAEKIGRRLDQLPVSSGPDRARAPRPNDRIKSSQAGLTTRWPQHCIESHVGNARRLQPELIGHFSRPFYPMRPLANQASECTGLGPSRLARSPRKPNHTTTDLEKDTKAGDRGLCSSGLCRRPNDSRTNVQALSVLRWRLGGARPLRELRGGGGGVWAVG